MERGGELVGTHNTKPMGWFMKLSVTSHETIKCHRCSRLGMPLREDTFLSWHLAPPVFEVTRGLTLPF
jgi:hypothetical protein